MEVPKIGKCYIWLIMIKWTKESHKTLKMPHRLNNSRFKSGVDLSQTDVRDCSYFD